MKRRLLLVGLGAAVMVRPRAPRAQERRRVIGFLHSGSPGAAAAYIGAFRHGLGDAGYVEGKNAAIEFRWAEGRYERLPALAAELVSRNVDVLVATAGAVSAQAAKAATREIPIVFHVGPDPVPSSNRRSSSSSSMSKLRTRSASISRPRFSPAPTR